MRRTSWAFRLAIVTTTAGCVGGQSGDLSGRGGEPDPAADGPCVDQVRTLQGDEISSLGFSPANVLAFAARSLTAPMFWLPTQGMTYTPGPGQSTLTVNVTSLGPAELLHGVHTQYPTSGEPVPLPLYVCPPDRMRLAVHVEAATADGALAEAFDGVMLSTDGRSASLVAELDRTTRRGTFGYRPADPAGSWSFAPFGYANLRAALTADGMAGDLFADVWSDVEQRSVETLTFARFPEDPACPSGPSWPPSRLPVTVDSTAFGASGNAIANDINARGPLPLQWRGGSSTELTLALSDVRTGCLNTSFGAAERVTYPVTLRAITADGQLDATYATSLSVDVTPPGVPARKRIGLDAPVEVGAIDRTGFPGASVPSDARALSVKIDATFDDGQASGSIELDASLPRCASPTTSTVAQCEGAIVTPLVAGTWASP